MRVNRLALSEWSDILPAKGVEVFHTSEVLDLVDEYTAGELHLLGGFNGDDPVGLLPISEETKLGGRLLTSPPLGLGIGRLGPIVMPSSPKQRKQEAINNEFVQEVIEELNADTPRTLVRISSSPDYIDPRPFQWNNFTVRPAFTYRISLRDVDAEQLLASFSRDLRSDIQKQDEVDFSVQVGGIKALRETYESIEQRVQELDQRHPLPWEFVRDLYTVLDDRARVYVARTETGEFIAGMIILYSNDTAYCWKGGAKTDRTVSPNSLIHWRIITDILDEPELEEVEQYDLYTANNKRLTRYKSKFGGTPEQYFIIESGGPVMKAAKGLYRVSELGKNPLGESEQI